MVKQKKKKGLLYLNYNLSDPIIHFFIIWFFFFKIENESNIDFEKTLSNSQKEKIDTTVDDSTDFEEKKYGWLVVLGAFMVQVTSFGTATSW